jgi:hypothetical protein
MWEIKISSLRKGGESLANIGGPFSPVVLEKKKPN